MNFSAETRNRNLIRLSQETFDLLVIGGGITGTGIAGEAARRGYKVALVEKNDFANGASSKSSKLIHGGLRYLATMKFRMVRSASNQRHKLFRLAPHLVRPLPFILPVYTDSPYPLWLIGTAMWLYDAMAGFRTPGRHEMWTVNQVLEKEPDLKAHGLIGAARYYDYATDDARLTLLTAHDAHREGAILANYTKVTGFIKAKNRIVGVYACDQHSDMEMEIQARVTISAVGPWTDRLLQLSPDPLKPWLHATKGTHLIVQRRQISSRAALTFRTPHNDRFMFAIPWKNRTILGTTDTGFHGDPGKTYATTEDVAYILKAAQRAFPAAKLNEDDVISTYTGVRPLIKQNGSAQPYTRSRQHRIDEVLPGLITIAGGKLTLHRVMAQETINKAARILANECRVFLPDLKSKKQKPLPGGNIDDWNSFLAQQQTAFAATTGLSDEVAGYLVATYGTEVVQLLTLIAKKPALAERITPELPVIKAQVIHAVQREMALTLIDVMDRRTHIMTHAADQGMQAAESVARLMATELRWTPRERVAQIAFYHREVAMSRYWRNGVVNDNGEGSLP